MTLHQRCNEYVNMRWSRITPEARLILGFEHHPDLKAFQTMMFTVQFYRQHEEAVQRLIDVANKIIHQTEISNIEDVHELKFVLELQDAVEGVGG